MKKPLGSPGLIFASIAEKSSASRFSAEHGGDELGVRDDADVVVAVVEAVAVVAAAVIDGDGAAVDPAALGVASDSGDVATAVDDLVGAAATAPGVVVDDVAEAMDATVGAAAATDGGAGDTERRDGERLGDIGRPRRPRGEVDGSLTLLVLLPRGEMSGRLSARERDWLEADSSWVAHGGLATVSMSSSSSSWLSFMLLLLSSLLVLVLRGLSVAPLLLNLPLTAGAERVSDRCGAGCTASSGSITASSPSLLE